MQFETKFAAGLCALLSACSVSFDHMDRRLLIPMNEVSHPIMVHAHRFTDEVKREAVERVRNGESRVKVAADIGVHIQNLYKWIATANGNPARHSNHKSTCPHCANLVAACKLVLVSVDGNRELRNSVARIVAEAVAAYDRTQTAPAAQGAQP